jgi:hypothetical protein
MPGQSYEKPLQKGMKEKPRKYQADDFLVSDWSRFETINTLRDLCLRPHPPKPELNQLTLATARGFRSVRFCQAGTNRSAPACTAWLSTPCRRPDALERLPWARIISIRSSIQ